MPDVTIKDVAKRANVSIATVSRVINNEPTVRKKTVEKVQQAILEINYVPNASARTLKSDTTKIIGLLVSDISNSHFTTMAKIIESVLRTQGYSVIISNTDDDAQQELFTLKRLTSLRVDGLILNITGKNNDYISELSHSLPIVLVERRIEDIRFTGDLICSNNTVGVRDMTRYLIERGHRRIGIINTELQVSTGQERYEGFVNAMAEIGVAVDKRYPYRYDSKIFNQEGGVKGCQTLMELPDRPTAIVVTNNAMALGVYKYLRRKHIDVPQDVSVLSYGNIENSELFALLPGYASLNPHYIGERAANHLLSRIANPSVPNREVCFEPSLFPNESVASV